MGNEIMWRLMWIAVVTALIAYGAYLFFGSIVQAETEAALTRVEVYDFLDRGARTHRLSGIIMVPTACHEVWVKSEELGPSAYHIYFSTFGDVHGCAEDPHPYAFRVVVPAPLVGVDFTATIDGVPVDFVIVSRAHS